MNYADTEKIRHVLLNVGFQESPRMEDADILILNTCSVRQRAEDKVLGLGRKITALKKTNPSVKVFLTGCMSQRLARNSESASRIELAYRRSLRLKMPWVDTIIGVGEIEQLCHVLEINPETVRKLSGQAYLSRVSAFVPISVGCDNFCSYCVVPFSRGKEVHRSYEEIRSQFEELVRNDYRMITLLGQNVNSWKGIISGKKAGFGVLLKNLASIPGSYWCTFLTSHPKDLSDELVQALSESEHVCTYLNLPVQSGSNTVLKTMNRKYTREQYLDKIEKVRTVVPKIRLSTDIIVGFPGENETDFQASMDLVKKVRYGMIYVSEYSPRMYTASAKLPDTVSTEEKVRRKKAIEDVQRSIMDEENKKALGSAIDILVTGEGRGLSNDLREVEILNTGERPQKIVAGTFIHGVVVGAKAAGLQVEIHV